MGRLTQLICFAWRIAWSPVIFLVIGVVGAWQFIRGRQEDFNDVREEIPYVAPEEEDEDRKRSYANDVWAKDLSPQQRMKAAVAAQENDGALVRNPIPIEIWNVERRIAHARGR